MAHDVLALDKQDFIFVVKGSFVYDGAPELKREGDVAAPIKPADLVTDPTLGNEAVKIAAKIDVLVTESNTELKAKLGLAPDAPDIVSLPYASIHIGKRGTAGIVRFDGTDEELAAGYELFFSKIRNLVRVLNQIDETRAKNRELVGKDIMAECSQAIWGRLSVSEMVESFAPAYGGNPILNSDYNHYSTGAFYGGIGGEKTLG